MLSGNIKIFIGIPSIRDYEPFWSSLSLFLNNLIGKYDYQVFKVSNKTLSEARNEIVSRFLESDKDYLLFLDDDHSGHTVKMLDSLLEPLVNNGRFVSAIKCYAKEFPYWSNLLQYNDSYFESRRCYDPIYDTEGYIECDLVGFGMTLISREVFKRISEPYFSSTNNQKEDNYFCDKLVMAGSRPIGCFDYVLEHNGIGEHNALDLRNKGMNELKRVNPDMKVLVS